MLTVDRGHATWNFDAWIHAGVDIPADFAIREVLESTDENIEDFMAKWGLLVRPYGHDWDAQPDGSLILNPFFAPSRMQRDDEPVPQSVLSCHLPHVSMSACRLHLRILRTLCRHYLAYAEGDDDGVVAAWASERMIWADDEDEETWFQLLHGEHALEDAWRRWAIYVNAALHAFPPRVGFVVDGERLIVGDAKGVPSTYEVAILQLAQISAEGRRVVRCVNEHCGRPFTRQRSDRRQFVGTEHAEGIKYCSRSCAKAQSERERRARRREERRTQ